MKIAIITWFFDNYGTVLQAYALNRYLNTIDGVEAKVINYDLKKENLDIPLRWLSVDSIEKIVKRIKSLKNKDSSDSHQIEDNGKAELFDLFRSKISMTGVKTKDELNDSANDFDAFICGSDQIWNPYFYDRSYFLDFVKEKKKIAYAPSLGGSTTLPFRLKGMYKNSLRSFYRLSVREEESCELIKNLSGKECAVMPDPVFLLTPLQWRSVNGQDREKKKYILCYLLSDNFWYKELIHKVEVDLKLNIKYIHTDGFGEYSENASTEYPGPKEFLNLIDNAEFVITDSFHGTCFSLLFNRDFLCLERFSNGKRFNENMRVKNLLTDVHLNDRYVAGKVKQIDYTELNWKTVNSDIAEMRKRGVLYLNDALGI